MEKRKIIGICCSLGLLGLILFYQLYFLRSPIRKIPHNNELFISPANGKIIAIIKQNELGDKKPELYKKHHKVLDNWTKGFSGAVLISIMMTPLDVHYQKAPLEAKVVDKKYIKGKFLNAMRNNQTLDSTFQNEYNNLLFITKEGFQFRIIQIAGYVARRIVDYVKINQEVKQGETIGLIKLGSQVSVILDENFEVTAKVGDKVIEGESILAKKNKK